MLVSDELKYVVLTDDKELWFTSYQTIADFFNVSISCVRSTLFGAKTKLRQRGISIYTLAEYDELSPVREHKVCRRRGERRHFGVRMLDRYTHEILDEFKSIQEAGDELGVDKPTAISACCRGKIPTAYGYKWEYIVDTETEGRYQVTVGDRMFFANSAKEVGEQIGVSPSTALRLISGSHKKTKKYGHISIDVKGVA